MIEGLNAIKFLSKSINSKEKVSSSHWNFLHKNFKYENGNLSGLIGFGAITKPHRGFLKKTHLMFQWIFRKMAKDIVLFNKIDKKANKITSFQNRANNLDVIRQSLTISFLNQKINFNRIENVIVIGDGFATMTSLLIENKLVERVYFINLRKTLLVDLIYLKKAIGDKRFERETAIINSKDSINSLKSKHKYVAIEAENYELLEYINKDLVINIASFQEMSKQVIDNYFKFIYNKSGKHFYFYLCNREEKELPDGEKIKFKNYNFESDDQILENELCPWHQYFYMKYPPFFKKFDGPTRHQLRLIQNK